MQRSQCAQSWSSASGKAAGVGKRVANITSCRPASLLAVTLYGSAIDIGRVTVDHGTRPDAGPFSHVFRIIEGEAKFDRFGQIDRMKAWDDQPARRFLDFVDDDPPMHVAKPLGDCGWRFGLLARRAGGSGLR